MLGARDVIVFFGRPDNLADAGVRSRALDVLAPDDRRHVERFRFERDRELALASRSLQRRALSACADLPPRAWRFVAGPHGRPEIEAPSIAPRLRFNVANTRGLVACAVTVDRDVGLDVEPWRDDAPDDLVQQCFALAEREALVALPVASRPRRFVELWTLKEAYIKARGLGLELPLEQITFTLDDGSPRLTLDPALATSPTAGSSHCGRPFRRTPRRCACDATTGRR